MRALPHAVRAVFLLMGFYLLGAALLTACAIAMYVLLHWAPVLSSIPVILSVPVLRGLFVLRVPTGTRPGLLLTEAEEPRLWHTVRELAERVGTDPPSEIVLTADPGASVTEDARFLALVPGTRRLHLGLPLLLGLDEAQVRAVLAHELGHYAHHDTRLVSLTVRGRTHVLRTIQHSESFARWQRKKAVDGHLRKAAKAAARGRARKRRKHLRRVVLLRRYSGTSLRMLIRLYTAYGNHYLRSTLAVSRRQEYAADRAAARITGRAATVSALREVPVLETAHEQYLHGYALMGVEAGLLPPHGEVFGGFGALLAARAPELAVLRAEPPLSDPSPYDSHPPVADRIERIEELPADAPGDEDARPATALLTDPGRTARALEGVALAADLRGLPRAPGWPELLQHTMEHGARTFTSPLRRALAAHTGGPATAGALLTVIDAGGLDALAARLPAATGEPAVARGAVREGLHEMVLAELTERGLVRWEFSWRRAARPVLAHPVVGSADGADALASAVTAAVARPPDTAPLRLLLAHADAGR
ncbi:M48 family metalloprotease [Streptomyces sp. NPDC059816]|uniref:M48 family metalloprotease n=1 Tax=Streptomyces sp. NPDC059816 TaxID=3346960 RepID=UPI00364A54CF